MAKSRTALAADLVLASKGYYKITGNPDAEAILRILVANPQMVPKVRQYVEGLEAEWRRIQASVFSTAPPAAQEAVK